MADCSTAHFVCRYHLMTNRGERCVYERLQEFRFEPNFSLQDLALNRLKEYVSELLQFFIENPTQMTDAEFMRNCIEPKCKILEEYFLDALPPRFINEIVKELTTVIFEDVKHATASAAIQFLLSDGEVPYGIAGTSREDVRNESQRNVKAWSKSVGLCMLSAICHPNLTALTVKRDCGLFNESLAPKMKNLKEIHFLIQKSTVPFNEIELKKCVLEYLKVAKNLEVFTSDVFSNELLEVLSTYCKSLRILSFKNCYEINEMNIQSFQNLSKFEHIEELHLDKLEVRENEFQELFSKTRFYKLTCSLKSHVPENFSNLVPNLTSLHLRGNKKSTDSLISLKSLKHLTHLTLAGLGEFEELEELFLHIGHQMVFLSLLATGGIDLHFIHKNLPNLHTLLLGKASGNRSVFKTEYSENHPLPEFNKVRKLQIDDDNILYIVSRFPDLRCVTLRHSVIGYQGLFHLVVCLLSRSTVEVINIKEEMHIDVCFIRQGDKLTVMKQESNCDMIECKQIKLEEYMRVLSQRMNVISDMLYRNLPFKGNENLWHVHSLENIFLNPVRDRVHPPLRKGSRVAQNFHAALSQLRSRIQIRRNDNYC